MEDDFTEKLAQEVRKIKENKEWQVEYLTLLMREREKYKEGVAKGKFEGEIKGTVETYKELGLSLSETIHRIARKFDFSLQRSEEEVHKYWM